jgi:hypothetical protein
VINIYEALLVVDKFYGLNELAEQALQQYEKSLRDCERVAKKFDGTNEIIDELKKIDENSYRVINKIHIPFSAHDYYWYRKQKERRIKFL